MKTEPYRQIRLLELNSNASERETLEQRFGQIWDSNQLREQFEVLGFLAPFCVVRQKSSGQKGSLEFQHSPRYYFNWVPDKP